MFCQECGAKIEDNQMFCSNCGARVEEEVQSETGALQCDDERTVLITSEDAVDDNEKTVFISNESAKGSVELEPGIPVMAESRGTSNRNETNEKIFCPHCGALNNGMDTFCANCGGSMDGSFVQTPVKKKSNLPFIIGGIVAAILVVVVGIVGISVLFGGKSGNSKEQIYYIKDESLFKTSLKKLEPIEVDDNIIEETNIAMGANIFAKYSADERYLFYFHIDDNGNKDLYYIDTKDKEAEAEKIDSDIDSYHYEVTADNKVVYSKNESLYVHDMKDKEKVASDISNFYVSDDGNTLLWLTMDEDRRLYSQDIELKNEKEKLDSEIDYISFTSGNFEHIVYVKENSIYLIEDLGEKEKIASDVTDVVSVGYNDDGIQIIYFEAESEDTPMSEFVKDDMTEDVDIEEPKEEDYQITKTKDGWYGPYEVTETSDEYYQKQDEYRAKLDRDNFRERLETTTVSVNSGKLVMYDTTTGEKVTVAEGYVDSTCGYGDVAGKAVATYMYTSEDNMPNLKFSEVYEQGIGMASDSIYQAIEKNAVLHIVVGDATAEVLGEDKELRNIISDGEKLYAITYELNSDNEAGDYELGELSIEAESLGEFTKLYGDASDLLSCDGGDLIYIKDYDYENGTCDLYMNDQKIDSDVNPNAVYHAEKDAVLYFTDMDEGVGTVKLYNGKESEKIADDAGQAYYIDNKKIAVLVDVSKKSRKGDLKLYNGKELEKIDTDVSQIIKF